MPPKTPRLINNRQDVNSQCLDAGTTGTRATFSQDFDWGTNDSHITASRGVDLQGPGPQARTDSSADPPATAAQGLDFKADDPPLDDPQTGDLQTNYEALLGRRAWQRLHGDIRRRFGCGYVHRATCYRGVMQDVSLSFTGRLLAQLCRLIGTPLSLHQGRDVPVTVKVYPDRRVGGLCWDRFYYFPGARVNRVRSTKCICRQSGLVEVVGGGFGMCLKVTERQGAICFESSRFFWQMGRCRFYIPSLFTPGKTTVVQTALAGGRFRFELEVVHTVLGLMFRQSGIFTEVETAADQ
ncbi:DUF4166 domain-containing protein [Exilibacterium tricleocarpae]|uniref:DUF4166 domain-containing protein n=1 Tax=Exilibacterium tricleocarpae TaxID=2591008 RepID=A0A545TNE7_9GAMM|nr:DUF4166 domain-containing protein [Exilibacterium tricleocarpae]TQV78747.1 DUF4166 domain-containing protein [Exilibacterium tricleocarpae]